MKRHSLQWRLPFSYALIALLAALVLGAILMLILDGYYRRVELTFLERNARQMSGRLADFLQDEVPAPALESQLAGLAFLTSTRIRLLDPDERLLIDTAELEQDNILTLSLELDSGPVTQSFSQTVSSIGSEVAYRSVIVVEELNREQRVEMTGSILSGTATVLDHETGAMIDLVSYFSPLEREFPFYQGGQGRGRFPFWQRAANAVRMPIHHFLTGELLGYVEVIETNPLGTEILTSVFWGWLLAGLGAVLAAAAAGWVAANRLTQPLRELTDITRRMAGGELDARTRIQRPDEVGALAGTFNQMADRIEQTVGLLRRFAADAAHELNTPLTALRANLELLQVDEPRQAARLQEAREQVARLEGLTADLLDLSRIEAHTEAPGPIDLTAVARDAAEPFAGRAEQREIPFELFLPDNPLPVAGHRWQLLRVIDNLLDNALKFTRPGGAISLVVAEENGAAVLSVSDTGDGIDPDDLPHLFERFYRGKNAAGSPGSGLGLAIVEAIVSHHGGSITAASDDSGTSFVVRLPRQSQSASR